MSTILIGLRNVTLGESYLKKISELAPGRDILLSRDRQEIESVKDEIEIAFYRSPYDSVLDLPNLKWMQQWAAGSNWLIEYPKMIDHPFVLTNSSGTHANPISEHVMGFMLTFSRRLHHAIESRMGHNWFKPEEDTLYELLGKTVLIVGLGAIGRRTAELSKCFGMKVLGIRKHPESTVEAVDQMSGPDQLNHLLPQADFVVLTLPLTKETEGMIGAEELRAMKPTAYLINVGRGDSLVVDDLVHALKDGWISGAALDVLTPSTPADDSPLWNMDNVILTSHYSSVSDLKDGRVFSLFLDNLRRFRDGQPLVNIVDKNRGY